MPVGPIAFKTPLVDAFLATATDMGFPVRDINTRSLFFTRFSNRTCLVEYRN